MAKIFKATLKTSFISSPCIFAAVFAFGLGMFEAFMYIVQFDGMSFDDTKLLNMDTYVFFPFLIVMLPALLTGKEISSGTVRNKLITGTTKTGFFMAHLIVNSLISISLVFLYFLPMLIFCSKYFDHFTPYMVAFAIVCVILGCLVITAVSTLFAVMFDKMIFGLAASVLLLLAFIWCSSWISSDLSQPKYEEYYDTNAYAVQSNESDDPSMESHGDLNPYYIESKTQRRLLWTASHIMPFEIITNGCSIISEKLTSYRCYLDAKKEAKDVFEQDDKALIIYERTRELFYVPFYSIGVTLFVSALGVFLFKRRNIK